MFEGSLEEGNELNIDDAAAVLGHSPQVALEHDIRMRPGNLRGMIERST